MRQGSILACVHLPTLLSGKKLVPINLADEIRSLKRRGCRLDPYAAYRIDFDWHLTTIVNIRASYRTAGLFSRSSGPVQAATGPIVPFGSTIDP